MTPCPRQEQVFKLPGVGSPVVLGSKEIEPANPEWGLKSLTLGRPATVSAPPPAQLDLYDLSATVKGLTKLELNGDVANGDLLMLSSLAKLKSLVVKNCRGVSGDNISTGKSIVFSLPCLHLMPVRISDICLTVRLTVFLLQAFSLALSYAG